MDHPPQSPTYCCPGQQHPISRAVHLGRLAAFYPACRECPCRDDTGTLSPRQVEQLQEVRSSNAPKALFHDEGAGGVYLNQLTPAAARQIATAFGAMIGGGRKGEGGRGKAEEVASGQWLVASKSEIRNQKSEIQNPSVLLAGDSRPITVEVTAAVGEGLRFGGCNVIDIGPATAACLAFAIHHFHKERGTGTSPQTESSGLTSHGSEPVPISSPAAGGILVGNPGGQPHVVGLQFWVAGPRPLSAGGSLEPLAELFHTGVSRPARQCGALQRVQADAHYLAALSQYYHALRPLRVVVDSASRPALEYLQRLAATVACEVIPSRVARGDLPEQVRAEAAHFAACIDGDGETCRVLDERGRAVPTERLLLLLARQLALGLPAIVLEESTPSAVARGIEELGARVVMSSVRRAEMAAAMSEHAAVLGGGPSGRFWYCEAGAPLPDALMTITRLLTLLSRSDEPFSAVLDREARLG